MHHPEGFWAASGGGIAASPELYPARIEDIAPTILSLFQLPDRVEGRVITKVVPAAGTTEKLEDKQPFPPAQRSDRKFSAADEELIKERLEGLGYL